jgi:ribosomal protein S14
MTYKIKNKHQEKCCECGKKTKSYYHTISLCSICLKRYKNGNQLKNIQYLKILKAGD